MLPKYYYYITSSPVSKFLLILTVLYPLLIIFLFKSNYVLMTAGELSIIFCLLRNAFLRYQQVVEKHIRLLKEYKYELSQQMGHIYKNISKGISEDDYYQNEIETSDIYIKKGMYLLWILPAIGAWIDYFQISKVHFHFGYYFLPVIMGIIEFVQIYSDTQRAYTNTLFEYIDTLNKEIPKGFNNIDWQKENMK